MNRTEYIWYQRFERFRRIERFERFESSNRLNSTRIPTPTSPIPPIPTPTAPIPSSSMGSKTTTETRDTTHSHCLLQLQIPSARHSQSYIPHTEIFRKSPTQTPSTLISDTTIHYYPLPIHYHTTIHYRYNDTLHYYFYYTTIHSPTIYFNTDS